MMSSWRWKWVMLFFPIIRVTAVISIMKDRLTRIKHNKCILSSFTRHGSLQIEDPQAQGEMSIFMLSDIGALKTNLKVWHIGMLSIFKWRTLGVLRKQILFLAFPCSLFSISPALTRKTTETKNSFFTWWTVETRTPSSKASHKT